MTSKSFKEITTENLSEYLQTLTAQQWGELWEFLPAMKAISESVKPDPNDTDKVAYKFLKKVHDLNLVVVFDWTEWHEGRELLADETADLSAQTPETLLKMITMIIRADRFAENALAYSIETRKLPRILDNLKKRVN